MQSSALLQQACHFSKTIDIACALRTQYQWFQKNGAGLLLNG